MDMLPNVDGVRSDGRGETSMYVVPGEQVKGEIADGLGTVPTPGEQVFGVYSRSEGVWLRCTSMVNMLDGSVMVEYNVRGTRCRKKLSEGSDDLQRAAVNTRSP